MNITKASNQWMSRPADERFTSLPSMLATMQRRRAVSRQTVVGSRRVTVEPDQDDRGLLVSGPNGAAYAPTNWAFGQLAQLAEAPAGYLRTLPAPIAADCVNYGLQFKREISDVGVLLERTEQLDDRGVPTMRAATGPRYGRIWNTEVVESLINRFGDGVTGKFRVPGEFGKAVEVNDSNTTLYAGDRDMFVFLADEQNRIEIPDRRNGETGSLARGFFVWNSEVGSQTLGIATFLFDYVCMNRIVWGATQYDEIRVRHTASAPDKFIQEITPALRQYADSSMQPISDAIQSARDARIDDVDDFLAKRFGKRTVESLKTVHMLEENRPIESLWDVSTAITAKAKSIEYQDERVKLERQAGDILNLAVN